MSNIFDVDGSVEKKEKQKKRATYNDYIELIANQLGDLRRDLFTGDLHYFDRRRKKWFPVLAEISEGYLKSLCRDTEGYFSAAALPDHILRYTHELPAKLLIDVPAWDGGERLNEIGRCVRCRNLSQEHVTEFLKHWGASMWRRCYDPDVEGNRFLIFRGPQGIGKDWLIKQMLGGLGSYLCPMAIFNQEKDTMDQLASSLVQHLEEYDRIHRTDVAALKNFITMTRARYRGAYARKAEYKTVRCSFIGSSNEDNLLRDATGNRRYIIFDVESIDWNYPQGDSLQILAEFKALSTKGFKASEGAEAAMAEYLKAKTPISAERHFIDDYLAAWQGEISAALTDKRGLYISGDIASKAIERVCKVHHWGINGAKNLLRTRGYSRRYKEGVRYYSESEDANEISEMNEDQRCPEPSDPSDLPDL